MPIFRVKTEHCILFFFFDILKQFFFFSFTYIPHPDPTSHLPLHPIPLGLFQCTSPEHLSHASNLDWWSVSPLIIYMFQCCSLEISHPRLLPQSPKVCSVHLCLFFCFAYRVIITIFLNSISWALHSWGDLCLCYSDWDRCMRAGCGGECLRWRQGRSGLSAWNTKNIVSQYKETWSRMKVTVSIAYCPCLLDGESQTLDTVLCLLQVSLITPGWASLPWGCWGGKFGEALM